VLPAYLGLSKNQRLTELCRKIDAGGDGGRKRKRMSVDTIEDIAVLGALLVFGSLSLAVIVLIY
jgi:hypothetical protein